MQEICVDFETLKKMIFHFCSFWCTCAQCTEKVEQGTFRENFKNFYRNPHSNVSYGLNVEIKDSLKS